MRVAIYDRVEPPIPAVLPVRLVATCSQRVAALLLAAAVPAVVAVGAASLMLLYEALFAPAMRAVLAQHPALGLEILAAIAFWVYLLGLPITRLVRRISITRTVDIDAQSVTVTEGGRWRSWTWSAPLSSFTGVAHHLRASLSGTRHELILVHPEKAKSVLLCVAPNLAQDEVDHVAQLLGQTEISSGELYRFRARLPRLAQPPWRHGSAPEALAART